MNKLVYVNVIAIVLIATAVIASLIFATGISKPSKQDHSTYPVECLLSDEDCAKIDIAAKRCLASGDTLAAKVLRATAKQGYYEEVRVFKDKK